MSNQSDLESIHSELVDLQQKHDKLKQKISKKCPECGQVEFKEIFTHAASAIAVLDADAKILFTNNFFETITGISQQESHDKPIHQILKAQGKYANDFLHNISCESECTANLIFPTINIHNTLIWLDMSVKTFSNSSLSSQNSICIIKDVTKEKEFELRRDELIQDLMEVKELQEDNSAQLNVLLHELDDKNIKLKKEISERKKAEQRLRESEERFKILSITDQLTGLYNRRHLQDIAYQEVSKCNLKENPLCTILMDVDDFKKYNDTYGHSAGDDVLERVGKLIQQSINETDSAFRYGGEEFLVLLPNTKSDKAIEIAERIRLTMQNEQYYPSDATPVQKTLSIGIAEYKPGESLEKMFKRADKNMYHAKVQGKNQVYLS